MSQVVEAPVEIEEPTFEDDRVVDRPWVVIVWNDPINLMSVVTLVLQRWFAASEAGPRAASLQSEGLLSYSRP